MYNLLPEDRWLRPGSQTTPYNSDWSFLKGQAGAVALPQNPNEISEILKFANAHRIPVVPAGGRTGLAGGASPTQGELVLSLEKLAKIIQEDQLNRSIEAETGVIQEVLIDRSEKMGFEFPIKTGSSGSCQLGGNLATNCGGSKFITNGSIGDHVLGLEVVLANGEILDLDSQLHKNNLGPDFKRIFIGSEGTLGIITKATIKLAPARQHKQVALLMVDNDQLDPIISTINQHLVHISWAELIHHSCFKLWERNSFGQTWTQAPSSWSCSKHVKIPKVSLSKRFFSNFTLGIISQMGLLPETLKKDGNSKSFGKTSQK